MRVLAKALCLLAIAATATAAKADTFKLTGDGDTYTFSIDASPIVTSTPFGFEVFGVTVKDKTDKTTMPDSTLIFYDDAPGGGFIIQSTNFIFDGDQLFSGSNDSPTFLLGTFKLTDDVDNSKYKLVIKADKGDPSASPVPEPSSLALVATGTFAFAGAVRRKLLAC